MTGVVRPYDYRQLRFSFRLWAKAIETVVVLYDIRTSPPVVRQFLMLPAL